MDSLLITKLYWIGIVLACGFAIICVILKQAVGEGSLRDGFYTLESYINFGIYELFKELFSKKTLKAFLWLIGLCILVAGVGGFLLILFS